MKKAVSVIVALIFMLNGTLHLVSALENDISLERYTDLITKYYEAINNKDYDSYLNLLYGAFKEDMNKLLPIIIDKQIGVAVVKNVDIKSIEIIADLSESEYSDIDDAIQYNITSTTKISKMKNLLVKCNIEVYKQNEYYFNGTNYFSIVCGDVSRELKVIDCRMAIPDAVAQYEPNRELISQYFNTRVEQTKCFSISDKFANEFKDTATYNGVMPSTINVWRISKDRIDYSVNFKQYCV